MKTTILAKSNHTLFLDSQDARAFEELDLKDFIGENYTSFYAVRNWAAGGHIFLYAAKHENKQVHVWYPKSKAMWTSFGTTFEKAINGAQQDGWMYA